MLLVCDNASVHKAVELKKLMNQYGIILRFLPPNMTQCIVVVFSLLVGARRRSAVRCGAERSGATARPKVFEEQSELEALSVFNGMRKATPATPCTPCDSWPFTTKCT
jgi:hypothetical protein